MVAGLRYAELIRPSTSASAKSSRTTGSAPRWVGCAASASMSRASHRNRRLCGQQPIDHRQCAHPGWRASAAGSLRQIELRRSGKLVSQFDLYELLLRGDKTADRVLQADDVVHIGPVGQQVALIGSVNRPGIFELKPSETIAELLQMGAGFSAVADRSRLAGGKPGHAQRCSHHRIQAASASAYAAQKRRLGACLQRHRCPFASASPEQARARRGRSAAAR